MIFVTVGSTLKPFDRLIREIDRLLGEGKIKEKVVMQTCHSTYEPIHAKKVERPFTFKGHEWIPFIKRDKDYIECIKKASIVITHAGGGTLQLLFKMRKRMVVVPRRKCFNEHYNDHQMELARAFEKEGLAKVVYDVRFLEDAIHEAKRMKVNFEYFRQDDRKLRKLLKKISKGKNVCLPLTPGGHFGEASPFLNTFDNSFIITLKRRYMQKELKGESHRRVYYVHDFNKNPFLNILKTLWIILKEKPSIVFSTGAGIAISATYLAKFLFKAKIIYIESIAQAYHKSCSGRLIYPIADLFFVRWESIRNVYGKKAKLLSYL